MTGNSFAMCYLFANSKIEADHHPLKQMLAETNVSRNNVEYKQHCDS